MSDKVVLYTMTQEQFNIVQGILGAVIRGEGAYLSDEDTWGIGAFGRIEMQQPVAFGHADVAR